MGTSLESDDERRPRIVEWSGVPSSVGTTRAHCSTALGVTRVPLRAVRARHGVSRGSQGGTRDGSLIVSRRARRTAMRGLRALIDWMLVVSKHEPVCLKSTGLARTLRSLWFTIFARGVEELAVDSFYVLGGVALKAEIRVRYLLLSVTTNCCFLFTSGRGS